MKLEKASRLREGNSVERNSERASLDYELNAPLHVIIIDKGCPSPADVF